MIEQLVLSSSFYSDPITTVVPSNDHDNAVAIGSEQNDDNGINSSQVYKFKYGAEDNIWKRQGNIITGRGTLGYVEIVGVNIR